MAETTEAARKWSARALTWDDDILDPSHYVNIEDGYARFLAFCRRMLDRWSEGKDRVSLTALDVGCGTGILAELLTQYCSAVKGIDCASAMVDVAEAKRGSLGIEFRVGDALSLPYQDQSVDIVATRGILVSHVGLRESSELLVECRRVLKSEGLLVFDFLANTKPEEHKVRAKKAIFSRSMMVDLLRQLGFSIIGYAGEPGFRVNAIAATNIS